MALFCAFPTKKASTSSKLVVVPTVGSTRTAVAAHSQQDQNWTNPDGSPLTTSKKMNTGLLVAPFILKAAHSWFAICREQSRLQTFSITWCFKSSSCRHIPARRIANTNHAPSTMGVQTSMKTISSLILQQMPFSSSVSLSALPLFNHQWNTGTSMEGLRSVQFRVDD